MSAFALGLTLFVMTLILNFIALRVVKKYTEKYNSLKISNENLKRRLNAERRFKMEL